MAINPKDAIALLQMVEEMKTRLQDVPELAALVTQMLNGVITTTPTHRKHSTISASRRKQMSVMMRKRWMLAKKSGKTIGGKPLSKPR